MKKKFMLKFVALVLVLTCFSKHSLADVIQKKDTVSGIVIDKHKTPLPGAKVEIIGQPYSAYTDLDGRFNIKCEPGAKKVRITYPKFQEAKKKIKPDMTVQLGRSWKQAPENYQWFVGASVGIVQPAILNDNFYDLAYQDESAADINITAGRIKKLGWYARLSFSLGAPYKSYGYSLGGLVRLGCPLHWYFGVGFRSTTFKEIIKYPGEYYYDYSFSNKNADFIRKGAVGGETGLLFRIKDHFGIDMSMAFFVNGDYSYLTVLNTGISYFFN